MCTVPRAHTSLMQNPEEALGIPPPIAIVYYNQHSILNRIAIDQVNTGCYYRTLQQFLKNSSCMYCCGEYWCDATPSGGEVEGHCNSILVVPLKPTKNYVFEYEDEVVLKLIWSTFSAASKLYQSEDVTESVSLQKSSTYRHLYNGIKISAILSNHPG